MAMQKPPAWLKPGFIVEVEIEKLAGCLIRSPKGPPPMPDNPVVLLTNPMHPDGEAILAPHVRLITAPDAQPDTLRKWAGEADGIIVRAKLPDDILDHAPRLKAMVRHGVGLDFIPVAAATALVRDGERLVPAELLGGATPTFAELKRTVDR